MMECKKALADCAGDMEKAIEALRKTGAAKAVKKEGRIAAEGVVVIAKEGNHAAMLEINSETDFVGRHVDFTAFAQAVGSAVLKNKECDTTRIPALSLPEYESRSVEEVRHELISRIGENVQIRRAVVTHPQAASIGTYIHGNRIGAMVELDIDNPELAHDLAIHVAASHPLVVSQENVSPDLIAKEKIIYAEQAASSGKPPAIVEKMIEGRLKKFLDEVSLVGQPFVKEPDITVGSLLNKHKAKVLAFHRFEVGEGIEKVTEDFKEAVMSQVQGG
jgi:elongation factor Ts